MSVRIAMVVLMLLILAAYRQAKPQANNSYNGLDLVDKAGNIRKPSDYRDRYRALGTYAVVDLNGGTDMHYTYASPGTAEYYRKTGKFADGTVLVKEVLATDHAQMATGDAHWATGMKSVVRYDQRRKGRYPGNSLWGDKWGWALFKSDAPEKQVATDYKKTAWAATSLLRRQTGSTCKAIQFLLQSERDPCRKLIFRRTTERS